MQVLITFIAIALLYVWVIVRSDTHRFVVREYHIVSPKLQSDYTVCVLSDLHEKDYGNGNEALYEAIAEIKPDAVISAGDLLTAHHNPGKYNDGAVRALIKKLTAGFPVYLGMGNHERKLSDSDAEYGGVYERFQKDMQEEGATFLRDTAPIPISGNICLSAINLGDSYFTHGRQKELTLAEMEKKAGTADATHFHILIAHEPSRFPVYAAWGADLVLSGHVHGGVARISGRGVIAPSLRIFPFYDGGAYTCTDGRAVRHPDGQMLYLKKDMHAMIQSRGLGTHSIHVRFLNPGELVVIRLHAGET